MELFTENKLDNFVIKLNHEEALQLSSLTEFVYRFSNEDCLKDRLSPEELVLAQKISDEFDKYLEY